VLPGAGAGPQLSSSNAALCGVFPDCRSVLVLCRKNTQVQQALADTWDRADEGLMKHGLFTTVSLIALTAGAATMGLWALGSLNLGQKRRNRGG